MPSYTGPSNIGFLDQTMGLLDEVLLFEHNRKLQGPTTAAATLNI